MNIHREGTIIGHAIQLIENKWWILKTSRVKERPI